MRLREPQKHFSGMRGAKIICTLGPSSSSLETIEAMIRAGMDVVRLNFSHGTHQDHMKAISLVRKAADRVGKVVPILADLQGPKIRTGTLNGSKSVELIRGRPFILTTKAVAGGPGRVGTDYRSLHKVVRKGSRILMDDGILEVEVVKVAGRDIHCRVVTGGPLFEHKGINLPNVDIKSPSLTPKDKVDMKFALKAGVDFIALSFVRKAADVRQARRYALQFSKKPFLMAKIEKTEALVELEEIMAASDGIMVARGDLGVEMDLEKVPAVQKRILTRAKDFRLPAITATQMLASMVLNPRPTRAEVSDIANAVFDGTSGLLLTNETAAGKYPVEAVKIIDRVIREAESVPPPIRRTRRKWRMEPAEAICEAVCNAAEALNFRLIAAFTKSGTTARLTAHYRPRVPIFAFSTDQETLHRTAIYWGVHPRLIGWVKDLAELEREVKKQLLVERVVESGDMIGIAAGMPLGRLGRTNLFKLLKI